MLGFDFIPNVTNISFYQSCLRRLNCQEQESAWVGGEAYLWVLVKQWPRATHKCAYPWALGYFAKNLRNSYF